MALSGQLSDLSLAELIEFFCNQRKTGRLKVAYTRAPGYFFFDRGDLVDARIGALSGVEAVYYSLTQANASFKFSAAFESTRRTIHQPWAQVALEGLRRLDEGIAPGDAFPTGSDVQGVYEDSEPDEQSEETTEGFIKAKTNVNLAGAASQKTTTAASSSSTPLSMAGYADDENDEAAVKKEGRPLIFSAVAIAVVLLIIAAVGIPAGWYGKSKSAAASGASHAPQLAEQAATSTNNSSIDSNAPEATAVEAERMENATTTNASGRADATASLAQQRERERLKAATEKAAVEAERLKSAAAAMPKPSASPLIATANTSNAQKLAVVKAAPKMATVQVTYDEAGRVTVTSGGDGTAQRIARQKRFPAGKGGTATVTIPIN
jgi:hypothetical protein